MPPYARSASPVVGVDRLEKNLGLGPRVMRFRHFHSTLWNGEILGVT